MAKTRRSTALLTESWGTVDIADESDSGASADIETSRRRSSRLRSLAPASEDDEDYDHHTPLRSATRKSARLSRQSTPSLESSSSKTRASRRGSRPGSIEPELIMPSIESLRSDASPQPRRRSRNQRRSSQTLAHSQQMPPASQTSQQSSSWLDPEVLWQHWIQPFLGAFLSIFYGVLNFLRPVAIWLLAFWAFVAACFLIANYLYASFSTSLSPICNIWGVSQLNLPFCTPTYPNATGPVEFEELVSVQSAFEDIISSSANGATLPMDMKRSESSIRDLKHVVRFSSLPSRNELVFEFEGFIETARQASSDLTKFNSRIGRSVDHIININKWTLHFLDDLSSSNPSIISRAVSALIPFTFSATPQANERKLLDRYLTHTSSVESQISDLILEAQALLSVLQNLDDRLDVIAAIVTRDGMHVAGTREDLFAQLWTKLGGNRSSVSKLNKQIQLLKEVSLYRKTAWAHVSGTLLKLQTIGAGLEDLRERVAAPEVVGVQIGGTGVVPLRMHIENIQSGVERLDAARGEQRRVEGESYRKVLEKGGMSDDRLVEAN